VGNNPINFNDPSGHRSCDDTDDDGKCITHSGNYVVDNENSKHKKLKADPDDDYLLSMNQTTVLGLETESTFSSYGCLEMESAYYSTYSQCTTFDVYYLSYLEGGDLRDFLEDLLAPDTAEGFVGNLLGLENYVGGTFGFIKNGIDNLWGYDYDRVYDAVAKSQKYGLLNNDMQPQPLTVGLFLNPIDTSNKGDRSLGKPLFTVETAGTYPTIVSLQGGINTYFTLMQMLNELTK